MSSSHLDAALARHGLCTRGGFRPGPSDGVPAALAAGTVVLVGNVGGAMWRAFAAAVDAADRAAAPHPLDGWIRSVVDPLAAAVGATALYPFDGPPYYPFQRWARRAGPVFDSPLGPLIDPDAGLWHAYRAALVFAERLPLPPRPVRADPCESCTDRPCLGGCPVDAIGRDRYDVAACVGHLQSPAGRDCREFGCRARRVCPVGDAFRYPRAQAQFHIAKFAASHAGAAAE